MWCGHLGGVSAGIISREVVWRGEKQGWGKIQKRAILYLLEIA
jgi:hypothetical protein